MIFQSLFLFFLGHPLVDELHTSIHCPMSCFIEFVFTPTAEGRSVELSQELERRVVQEPIRIGVEEPTIASLVQTNTALRVAPLSPLGRASTPRNAHLCAMAGKCCTPLEMQYF